MYVSPLLSCSNKAHALYPKNPLLLDTVAHKDTSVQIYKLVNGKRQKGVIFKGPRFEDMIKTSKKYASSLSVLNIVIPKNLDLMFSIHTC